METLGASQWTFLAPADQGPSQLSWEEEQKGRNRSKCHQDSNKHIMPWREREKEKNPGAKPTATSAYAETRFICFLLGDIAQLVTDVLCILSLGLKEMSRYDWENYNVNIPFPSSSLLHIFHYTSLWCWQLNVNELLSSLHLPPWFCHVLSLTVCVCLIYSTKKKAKQHK